MLQYQIFKHRLHFKFAAGTSRGVLNHKDTWYLKIWEAHQRQVFGVGECSPLAGLSIDYREDYESVLDDVCQSLFKGTESASDLAGRFFASSELANTYPSMVFGLESALLDLQNGGTRKFLKNGFYDLRQPISINGLVWMGDKDFMLQQVDEKIKLGFDCIKIKVGALDIDQEVSVIQHIRSKYSKDKITIRLDANGAFTEENVFAMLDKYAVFDIHSIEQPIKQGQWKLMEKVCKDSPIPIALDEELIGIEDKVSILKEIQPQYIILKPSLLGGIAASKEWIKEAESLNIGWWMTSLLESNIGLNAIAQLTSHLKTNIPQGLGTGQLYHNNIPSPLYIDNGKLYYGKQNEWQLPFADQ